ncbi:MAG: hypothetical protein IMZ41_00270 [Actinobacteria bacterium]|nr:hypothetical protein [Actinomycetota bacterium]
MNSAISIENVKKTLGNREVLKGISFSVGIGDIFGYLGPNGAGKTTIKNTYYFKIRPR